MKSDVLDKVNFIVANHSKIESRISIRVWIRFVMNLNFFNATCCNWLFLLLAAPRLNAFERQSTAPAAKAFWASLKSISYLELFCRMVYIFWQLQLQMPFWALAWKWMLRDKRFLSFTVLFDKFCIIGRKRNYKSTNLHSRALRRGMSFQIL